VRICIKGGATDVWGEAVASNCPPLDPPLCMAHVQINNILYFKSPINVNKYTVYSIFFTELNSKTKQS